MRGLFQNWDKICFPSTVLGGGAKCTLFYIFKSSDLSFVVQLNADDLFRDLRLKISIRESISEVIPVHCVKSTGRQLSTEPF